METKKWNNLINLAQNKIETELQYIELFTLANIPQTLFLISTDTILHVIKL